MAAFDLNAVIRGLADFEAFEVIIISGNFKAPGRPPGRRIQIRIRRKNVVEIQDGVFAGVIENTNAFLLRTLLVEYDGGGVAVNAAPQKERVAGLHQTESFTDIEKGRFDAAVVVVVASFFGGRTIKNAVTVRFKSSCDGFFGVHVKQFDRIASAQVAAPAHKARIEGRIGKSMQFHGATLRVKRSIGRFQHPAFTLNLEVQCVFPEAFFAADYSDFVHVRSAVRSKSRHQKPVGAFA